MTYTHYNRSKKISKKNFQNPRITPKDLTGQELSKTYRKRIILKSRRKTQIQQ